MSMWIYLHDARQNLVKLEFESPYKDLMISKVLHLPKSTIITTNTIYLQDCNIVFSINHWKLCKFSSNATIMDQVKLLGKSKF